MRKFTKAVAVIAAVSMLGLSFAGCSKSKKKNDSENGKYVAKVDMTETLEESMGIDLDGTIEMKIYLELKDGEGEINANADEFKSDLESLMEDNLDNIVESLLGLSVAEAAEMSDMSEDEFRDLMMSSFADGMGDMEDMHSEGKYEMDGDTIIFLSEDGDEDMTGEYTGDTIILKADDDMQNALGVTEIVFERE